MKKKQPIRWTLVCANARCRRPAVLTYDGHAYCGRHGQQIVETCLTASGDQDHEHQERAPAVA